MAVRLSRFWISRSKRMGSPITKLPVVVPVESRSTYVVEKSSMKPEPLLPLLSPLTKLQLE